MAKSSDIDLSNNLAHSNTPESLEGARYYTRIEASTGWQSLDLKELWQYRDLLRFMVIREIKGKYQQMAFGPLWAVLQPVASMVLYSLIFGGLAQLPSEGIPYPIFAYAALLPWGYFSGLASGTASSLRRSMDLISKVYFPRLIVPVNLMITGLYNFGISFVILLFMMIFYQTVPSIAILTLPLYILFAAMIGMGFGFWFAGMSVRYRDVSFVFGYLMTAWQWATPVAYSAEVIAERAPSLYFLFRLNPMYWVVQGFRWALFDKGEAPQLIMLIPIGFTLIVFVSGMYVFRRTERTVVDIR